MIPFFRKKKLPPGAKPAVKENLGFGTPRLFVTTPSGERFVLKGKFRPYIARAFLDAHGQAVKGLLEEGRKTKKGVIGIIRERNAKVLRRSSFTSRPKKEFSPKALARYFRGRGNVASDPGYAELHGEASWARHQLSTIVNYHFEKAKNRLTVGPKNFFLSSGNTGTLQIVSGAISNWRPFTHTQGRPLLLEGDPSYWGYGPQLAAGAGFENARVQHRHGFVRDFIEQINARKPDLAYLMTPHNPTGKAVLDSEIIQIAKNLPTQTVLLVDMTISSNRQDQRTPLKKLADLMSQIGVGKKVIFFVSASKEYQLVRERVGIAITMNPELAKFLNNPSALSKENANPRFNNAILFDDKTVSPSIAKVLKRMTATELGISTASRRIIGGTTYHIEKAALSQSYRILQERAPELKLEIIPNASGTFTVIGLPNKIPAKELLDWFEKRGYWKKEDQAYSLGDILPNQLRIYAGHPKTLDRWLNYMQLFLIEKGVIPVPAKRRRK